ncbi:hypothetical protein ATCV1_z677L [Acanthocystis turfacea chlorella virus 1]|uniref:Uncharacterized protein z677L n=1 Tax=Chlorovirus heliozoae TaxID=322019 RepID=A7K9T7_9PHYC|nr:hypothetical protein ATCV1_z677L [Acanthocystis turfacea chlorella virus 1]ABT16811.1 hypothetical protein ATCV1_z677L [Acanthocystis turfacea chlorella virus 1]
MLYISVSGVVSVSRRMPASPASHVLHPASSSSKSSVSLSRSIICFIVNTDPGRTPASPSEHSLHPSSSLSKFMI